MEPKLVNSKVKLKAFGLTRELITCDNYSVKTNRSTTISRNILPPFEWEIYYKFGHDVEKLCKFQALCDKWTGNGMQGLIGPNAGKSSCAIRGSHTIPKGRKSQVDTDSGLIDPNLSVWRSINAEHKEVEQVPTDQTENIMNYYKDRWIQEHKDRKETETISGAEVTREEGNATDRRSLYSQLARKTASANKGNQGNMHPGLHYNNDSAMKSYDQFRMQKMAGNPTTTGTVGPSTYNQDIDMRDMKSQLRSNETAPGFWEKSPYNKGIPAMSFEPNRPPGQDHTIPQVRPLDPNGPYRPSFSVAEMLGNKPDCSKNESDEQSEAKPGNRYGSTETQKESVEKNLSPFQPAAPPVPDFKSS